MIDKRRSRHQKRRTTAPGRGVSIWKTQEEGVQCYIDLEGRVVKKPGAFNVAKQEFKMLELYGISRKSRVSIWIDATSQK